MKKEKKEELSIFLEKIGINNSKVLERIVSLTKKERVSIAKAIEIIADAKKEIDIDSEEYQLLLASQTLTSEIEKIDAI
jgi:hypothetical protein